MGDPSEYNIDKKVLNHRIYSINGSISRIFCQCPLFWKAKIVKKLFEHFSNYYFHLIIFPRLKESKTCLDSPEYEIIT